MFDEEYEVDFESEKISENTFVKDKKNYKSKRKREKQIKIYVSSMEFMQIKTLAEFSGLRSMREYLVKSALKAKIVRADMTAMVEMNRLLSNLTNNVNQIAKKVNQTQRINSMEVAELRGLYGNFRGQFNEMISEILAYFEK